MLLPVDPPYSHPTLHHISSHKAYVDDQLIGTGKIVRAAIVGKQGGVWASSQGYNLAKDEQNFLTSTLFTNPGEAQSHGIQLGGTKFMTIKAEPDEVIGRKGDRGVFIVPTNLALLVAEYEAPTPAGDASLVIGKLAAYLKSVNY